MQTFQTARRRPGLTVSSRKKLPFKILCGIIVATLGIIPLYHATIASADWKPTVQIVAPTGSAVTRGPVTIKFKVDGLSVDQYEPFWAVGDGTWNRMSTANGINYADIDMTNWNWNADNTYNISYIALQKDSWQPLIQKRNFTLTREVIKETPVQTTTPVQVPMTPTPTAPVVSAPVVNLEEDIPSVPAKTLYIDPESDAQLKARNWVLSHPEDTSLMNKLVSQPLANWYGGWNQDVRSDVDRYVTNAAAAGQIPVLVAYNIPFRDCGSYSAGGVSSRQAYTSWMNEFTKGIGNRDAIVLLEPDALPALDCLSKTAQAERIDMLKTSVKTLKASTKSKVYLDAGHPEWQSTSVMASRLKQAGVAEADGFSLNVSNFTSTEKNTAYGRDLSKKTNGAHFVIDTSRNGNGAAANLEWCNPSGVKVGRAPTLATGQDLVDAYVWVKAPGGSDGTCGSKQMGTTAPSAGEWWPQYALHILR